MVPQKYTWICEEVLVLMEDLLKSLKRTQRGVLEDVPGVFEEGSPPPSLLEED